MTRRTDSTRPSVVLLALGLAACGPSSTPTPVSSPSTRTVLGTLSFSLPPGSATFNSFDGIAPGTIDAQVDWDAAANDINLYATDLACPGFVELRTGRCRVLAQAATTAKPERLTFFHAALGDFRIWTHNASVRAETLRIEVGATR